MTSSLRFGIALLPNRPWTELLDDVRRLESLGWDSVATADHFVNPFAPEQPWFEGWSLLAGLAASTRRIRIGMLVTCVTFRNPVLFAREVLTVDHISGGRVDVGFGAGYDEREHTMMGVSLPPPGERVARYREVVELVDRLLRQEETTYAGRFYQAKGALMAPRPVQAPRPPLVLSGRQPRMLRIAAELGDVWNATPALTMAEIEICVARLDEACAALGREPKTLARSRVFTQPGRHGGDASEFAWESPGRFEEVVGRHRELGFSEFVAGIPATHSQWAQLERISADVLPRLRAEGSPPAPECR